MDGTCDKAEEIEKQGKSLKEQEEVLSQHGNMLQHQNSKMDLLLQNQAQQSVDLKQALDRLTSLIEEDIGTRKDVEQLKKNEEILFASHRKDAARIELIELRNAKCDGAGIFENFPVVWQWMHQEKGFRRFLPAVCTVICTIAVIYSTWFV